MFRGRWSEPPVGCRRTLKIDSSPHRFRSLFPSWSWDDRLGTGAAAPAHAVGSQSDECYARSDVLECRARGLGPRARSWWSGRRRRLGTARRRSPLSVLPKVLTGRGSAAAWGASIAWALAGYKTDADVSDLVEAVAPSGLRYVHRLPRSRPSIAQVPRRPGSPEPLAKLPSMSMQGQADEAAAALAKLAELGSRITDCLGAAADNLDAGDLEAAADHLDEAARLGMESAELQRAAAEHNTAQAAILRLHASGPVRHQ